LLRDNNQPLRATRATRSLPHGRDDTRSYKRWNLHRSNANFSDTFAVFLTVETLPRTLECTTRMTTGSSFSRASASAMTSRTTFSFQLASE
jgi:hypothetical protein